MDWLRTVITTVWSWIRLIDDSYTYRIVTGAWEQAVNLLPWFLFGLALTAALTSFMPASMLTRGLRRTKHWGLLIAGILGLISPFATYAVIPLAVILLQQGVALAPVVTFMIASPLMNPSIFVLTMGGMGLSMALARSMAALLISLAGGIWAGAVYGSKHPAVCLKEQPTHSQTLRFRHYQKSLDGLRSGRYHRLLEGKEGAKTWLFNFRMQLKFAGRYFLIAIVISALVQHLVPYEWVTYLLGSNSKFSVLIAAIIGIPFYTCGGAAIPMMQVLTEMGMSQGAVLAFFITGPATNISTIYTVGALFKRRLLWIYYTTMLLGATIAGYVYELIT
ncbi:MAG TPA: permease [Firmicutes bacterium]|jgi:uncharacterized membrane protein YraQ (UPF0718 family)|nr:permease [Bacillota bacterium]